MEYGYKTTIAEISANRENIISALTAYIEKIGYKYQEDMLAQKVAWEKEIDFLIDSFDCSVVNGGIPVVFEYMFPNENTERPDVLFLCKEKIVSLEFKTSGCRVDMDYMTQSIGYRDFLENYHGYNVVHKMPVESYLVFSGVNDEQIIVQQEVKRKYDESDLTTILAKDSFITVLNSLLGMMPLDETDEWLASRRTRSLKVWKSAERLKDALKYGDIGSLSHISGIKYKYLRKTDECISSVIDSTHGKRIIFVSGVPGAGKTLIGMLTLFRNQAKRCNTRYYTGNGALIHVLRYKLNTRDISFFTSFRENYIKNDNVCNEQILIFDEAQRFWTAEQARTPLSDAAGIINAKYNGDITLVCLIGNGQRPMQGEAGIEAWIEALKENTSWQVYASSEYDADFKNALGRRVCVKHNLFLDTSMRADFTDTTPFVEAVLAGDFIVAKREYTQIKNKTRILMTRTFETLYGLDKDGYSLLRKQQIKSQAEDQNEYLFGILCSAKSNAEDIDWYISGRLKESDQHSRRKEKSLYTDNRMAGKWYSGECCSENPICVATETFCQGLEIDLPILLFGGDYYLIQNGDCFEWHIADNKQTRKLPIDERKTIMQDTYRILMTRTTRNMFFYIPQNHILDDTYRFFKEIGIEEWTRMPI